MLVVAFPANANATVNPGVALTPEQRAELETGLDLFDVSDADIDSLINKLEQGIRWDSFSDAEPVEIEYDAVEGFDYAISRYEDGSFIAAGIEQSAVASDGDVAPLSVGGCATSGTSAGVAYGTDCTVRVDSGTVSGEFKASWSAWSGGASIYNVGSGHVNYDLGTYNGDGSFSSSTTSGTSKWTQFNWSVNTGAWGTLSRYVRLTVGPGGAVSSANY